MRIYVAGALSSKEDTGRDPSTIVIDYIQNIHKMCKAASTIRRKGHSPYVPGLDFLLGAVAGDWKEDDYRGIGMEFLEVCDAIVVTSRSWGVEQELRVASELRLTVYNNLGEVPDVT